MDLSGRMGYKVGLGESVQTQATYKDIRLLRRKLKDGSISCKEIHFDECISAAMEAAMVAENGCVVPWIVTRRERDICKEEKVMIISMI